MLNQRKAGNRCKSVGHREQGPNMTQVGHAGHQMKSNGMHKHKDIATYIHPTAICDADCVGTGTRVWAFAHVMKGATVGRDCNICDHVFVETGGTIGDGVTVKNNVLIWDGVTILDRAFIGPGVIFTNDRYPRSRHVEDAAPRYDHPRKWLSSTTVETGATIGAGSIILCGCDIGAYACVGAGSLVTHSVPAHTLVVGRPARVVGWVCLCGVPLDEDCYCRPCKRQFALDNDSLVSAEPM